MTVPDPDPTPAAAPAASTPAPAASPYAPSAPPAASPYAPAAASPYAPPAYTLPAPPRFTTLTVPLLFALGGALILGAVVNGVFSGFFPSNAPVEQIYSFGVTVDLVLAALPLLIVGLVLVRRQRDTTAGPRLRVFSVVGAVLAILVAITWAGLGGIDYWTAPARGFGQQYMVASFGFFIAGIPWAAAVVFSALGVRRAGGAINAGIAWGGLVLSLIVGASTVAATVLYGLGLTS